MRRYSHSQEFILILFEKYGQSTQVYIVNITEKPKVSHLN